MAEFLACALSSGSIMQPLLREIRHSRFLWLLVVVPIVLVAEKLLPKRTHARRRYHLVSR